jgi:hypothetical protein
MNCAMRVPLLGVFLVGCSGSTHEGPDATPDTPSGTPGLNVAWHAQPSSVPGQVTDKIMISSATFSAQLLRVVGDAGPGDLRTTAPQPTLAWSSGVTPPTINFSSAPTGLYSEVLVEIDGLIIANTFEIRGQVHRDSDNKDWQFFLHNRTDSLDVSIQNINTTLNPGAMVTIHIGVDFEHALTSLNYDQLDVENNTLDLDDGDGQADSFRHALEESFHLESGGDL